MERSDTHNNNTPSSTSRRPAPGRTFVLTFAAGIVMASFCLLCRFSAPVADFYATSLYPGISAVLSFISAFSPVDLEEIALLLLLLAIVGQIVLACIGRIRWVKCIGRLASILLWTYVWFYWGWCNLYSRSSLHTRTQTEASEFDAASFQAFASSFVEDANQAWTSRRLTSQPRLEELVKGFYGRTPDVYGLSTPRSWHHPKRIITNGIYSSVGIQGFMAPLFAESCINSDVVPADQPFVYAHEYAHLMGVSSEAEANWWAFHACISSGDEAMRYSGYKGIITHLMRNARRCLTETEYKEWLHTIRPEIIDDLRETQHHWQGLLSPRLNELQETTFDSFLKNNNVTAGMKDYSLVISLLIDIPLDIQPDRNHD